MATTRLNKSNPRDNRSKANNVRKDLERSLYLIKQKRLNKSRSYKDNRLICARSGCKNKVRYHSKRKFCSQCTDMEKHNLLKQNSHSSKNMNTMESHTELESCSKEKTKESCTELESCSESKCSKNSKTELENCSKEKTNESCTELESCSKESCSESKCSKKSKAKESCLENNNNVVDDQHESSDVSSSSESTASVSCVEYESSPGLFDDSSSALSSKSKLTLSRSILPSSSSITSYEPSSDKSSIEQVFSPEEKGSDDTLSNDSSFKCDTGEKIKLIKIK